MINKLERKFTIVATLVIVFVLLLILSVVNIISIRNNVLRSDDILRRISYEIMLKEAHLGNKPQSRPLDRDKDRTFDVTVNQEGHVIKFASSNTNASKNTTSQELVDMVLAQNTEKGFVKEFRYLVLDDSDNKRIFFLDYSFEKNSELTFLKGSALVFFAAVILVIALVLLFLKPVMKPIKETYAKQKRFITDASHEIRTPLAIISTNIQLIEMETDASQWTESIQKQVHRLEELSESLVSLARLDEDDIKMIQEKVDLSSVVNDVVMGFEPAIYNSKMTLSTHIQDGVFVYGNHDGLEKVLSTLLNNSLKYANKHGTFNIELHAKSSRISLLIENTSDNLEVKTYDEYFERFYRAEASRNSQTGGFGIGLAIAKGIIEEHKGNIKAYSKDGKTFSIVIHLKEFKNN